MPNRTRDRGNIDAVMLDVDAGVGQQTLKAEFNQRLEGSPIRRIGHERWLRNLAVGLGNSLRAASGVCAFAVWTRCSS